MRIHCLKHVPFEGPAGIALWANEQGHEMTTTSVFEGGGFPASSEFDWLLVMGGPMGVHDESEHPWLVGEKRFIGEAIEAGKTVVGICLGAQLIAEVLGASVGRNPDKEIGWLPIELTEAGQRSRVMGFLPPSLQVFQWHGDTFDLPVGAVHLARSEVCENQAFLYDDRVLALQFHLESTPESVSDLVANCADEILPATHVQSAERMLAATLEDFGHIHQALFGMLDRLPD